MPQEQIATRIEHATAKPNNPKLQLARNPFPPGSPGFCVLQAAIRMAGVEDVSNPDGWLILVTK